MSQNLDQSQKTEAQQEILVRKAEENNKLKGQRMQVIAEKLKQSIRRNLTGQYSYEFDKYQDVRDIKNIMTQRA